MDYSKDTARGGTRVHDPVKHRSLGTGMGPTVASNRRTGSSRMTDVHNRIPHDKRDSISDPAHADLQAQGGGMDGFGGMVMPMDHPAKGQGDQAMSKGVRDFGQKGEPKGPAMHVSPSSHPPGPPRQMKVPGATQNGIAAASGMLKGI